MLKPLDKGNAEDNEISWTKLKKLNQKDTINSLQELHHPLQTKNEFPNIPLQSSFQHGPDDQNNQSIQLEDSPVPLEV